MKRGKVIVVSGVTASGKTTLVRELSRLTDGIGSPLMIIVSMHCPQHHLLIIFYKIPAQRSINMTSVCY